MYRNFNESPSRRTNNDHLLLPGLPQQHDRQYSDEFEGPVVPFTVEQDDNGEEPSVSHDGSRLLEDLINSVGPDILPSKSSSDEDEDFHGEFKRSQQPIIYQRTRNSTGGTIKGRRDRQNLSVRRVPPMVSRQADCAVCGKSYTSQAKLDEHLQRHASGSILDSDTDHDDEMCNDQLWVDERFMMDMDDGLRFLPPVRSSSGPLVVLRNTSGTNQGLLDMPRDLTNLVFGYLHPMDWTRSCAVVNKLFWSVTQFKWGRVDIYALQGLSPKKEYGEDYRAEFLGRHATRLKTLIIENCGIEAQSFVRLTRNLHRLEVLVLEWSPRVLKNSVARQAASLCPPMGDRGRKQMDGENDDSMSGDGDVVMFEQDEVDDHSLMELEADETVNWDALGTFSGQLRVIIVRGIGPHISSSAFKWLLSNSHNSLHHLTISRKDPTRCQRPGCGACTLWKFQACAQCKMATYCSRRCQKRHWRNHKSICQECAKSPKDRMIFDDILLDSIIQCVNLIRLDLSRTFRLDDRRLVMIAKHCTQLIDVSLDGNHHISDRGVEPFVRALPKLHTLRLNVCSRIGNQTIEALSQTCADHLTVLELGCCYRVSETALMDLVVTCTKLQSLNIACGFQRRQILWNFSDELAERILDHLVHLKVLYVVSTISLSDDVRRKLDEHPNLRVYSALTLAPPLDPHQVHHVDHPGT